MNPDGGCRLRWLLAAVAGLTSMLAPIGAARCVAATPSLWQSVTFAQIAIPGTGQRLNVTVSREVLVDAPPGGGTYQQIVAGGKAEPSFLRVDVSWSSLDDASCGPVPMPGPIADGKEIRIALHQGAEVLRAERPRDWIGVHWKCGTTWSIIQHFPTRKGGLDEAWFEIEAAGRTYWVELPYGLARSPLDPGIDERERGDATFPANLKAPTDRDVLVPWAAVRYPLDGVGFLDMVDACDGVAKVTLSETSRWTIDRPAIAVEIHRPDGSTFKGREISRSIGPRQSTFDFRSRGASSSRTWDAVRVDVDGTRTTVTIPSSLYLLGHRLANWGDPRRIPVPDAGCKAL